MDLMQLFPDFRSNIPTKCRANNSRTQEIKSRLVISQHKGKIFGHIVKKDFQRWLGSNILLGVEDAIFQDPLVYQCEMLRVPGTYVLQDHLHELFAC